MTEKGDSCMTNGKPAAGYNTDYGAKHENGIIEDDKSRLVSGMDEIDFIKRMSTYFSVQFINTPSTEIDKVIYHALMEIGQYYDVECCRVFQFNEGNNIFDCINIWAMENSEIPNKYYPINFNAFSWLIEKMYKKDVVNLGNLNDLPPEAALERRYYESIGCKSAIFLPISKEDKVLGILELVTCRDEKGWSDEQIDLLNFIGSIFVCAISRKKNEETLLNEMDKLVKRQQSLRESEQIYSKLVLSIHDAIIRLDYDGKIVSWNKAAEEIFGYTYEEAVNKELHKLIVPNDMIHKAEENFMKFKETGKGRYIDKVTEVHAVKKDGSRIIAEVSISTIKFKGTVQAIGIVRDITERRQTQQKLLDAMDAAEAANKSKSQFLANISHEIRTPMNGIVGFLDILSKTQLDSKQNDYIMEIKTATDALMDLVNDLLDFSKIEANKLELENIEFDLRKVIEEATAMFTLKAYTKEIGINAMIDNAIPARVMGDPGKLKQVIINLISNAVKFTQDGQVTVMVKPLSQSAEKVDVFFSVSDTGIGISEGDRKKLFEPFTQVDASTTRKYGGTGLGLSICERLVEMMSGKITISSEIRKGSTFSFCISFGKAQEETIKPDRSLSGLRILVADSSSINRKIVRNYLEGAGCIVSEADNAMNAIESINNSLFNNKKIDMILLDNLPDGNGIDIAGRIKAEDRFKDIIINLFTPYANPYEIETVNTSGISNLIIKPVYRNQLINQILSSLGRPIKIETERTAIQDDNVIFSEIQKKKLRILLAEDNVTNQKLAATILNNAGLKYVICNNGYEAVKAIENRKYDLILMDCQMPEMDGYEATKNIRQMEAGSSHAIIIAMTANVMKEDIDKCLACGMDDYIGKPFKSDYLLKTILKWINSKQFTLPKNDSAKVGLQENTKEENIKEERPGLSDLNILNENTMIRVDSVNKETIDLKEVNRKDIKSVSTLNLVKEEKRTTIPYILDKLSLEQQIDRADIYEIYNEYVDLLPEILNKLQSVVDGCDFAEISAQAHTLKGASATLRLNYMASIADKLNQHAKAEDSILCQKIMKKLKEYCKTNIKHVDL